MRVPLSDALRRLDRHWLLNHPLLWIMRLHWVVYFWLLGLALICLVALVLPVSLQTVRSLNTYFLGALALAGLAISPWVYLQARFAPQLRQNSQARTAVYLLAGYLFIFIIPLAWPYALVGILELKISSKIKEGDLRTDYSTIQAIINGYSEDQNNRSAFNLPIPPKRQKRFYALQTLRTKYYQESRGVTVVSSENENFIISDLQDLMARLHLVKGIDPIDPFFDKGRPYIDWGYKGLAAFVSLGMIILLQALFLRVFQMTNVASLLATLFFGTAVLIGLALYSGFLSVTLSTILLLFSAGGYAAFHAPRLRRRSVLVATGMNIFLLMLAWVPLLLRLSSKSSSLLFSNLVYFSVGLLEADFFLLGIVLLFAITPWIQRRYLALQAKPS